jgi:hypothetical protein
MRLQSFCFTGRASRAVLPRFEEHPTRLVLSLYIYLAMLLLLAGTGLQSLAQTAHYPGQQTTVDGDVPDPLGVAVDTQGNVYIPGLFRIYKETPPASGSGPYTRVTIGKLNLVNHKYIPEFLAVDGHENVYAIAANPYNQAVQILKLSKANNYALTVLPNIGDYAGIAVDGSETLYIPNYTGGHSMLKLTPSGSGYTTGSVGPGWAGPEGVAVDGKGNIYVSVVDGTGFYRARAGCSGSGCSQIQVAVGLTFARGLAADASGDVYVADVSRASVFEVPWKSATQSYGASIGVGYGLNDPHGVAVDSRGTIYIADSGNNRVVKVQLGPVNFGTWTVGTTSPPRSITFIFDTGGTLGSTFVHTVGTTTPNIPPGTDFSAASGSTCTANHTYNPGDTCKIVATCTPQNVATFAGLAGLENSSGEVIATASLLCTGESRPVFSGQATRMVCTTYDECGDIVKSDPGTIAIYSQPEGVVTKENNGGPYCMLGSAHPPAETICTKETLTPIKKQKP